MVRKPNVRQEHFQLLREQIVFWNEAIENAKGILAHARLVKNKNVRTLLKLQKRYAEQ
jgi:hypothetical protein